MTCKISERCFAPAAHQVRASFLILASSEGIDRCCFWKFTCYASSRFFMWLTTKESERPLAESLVDWPYLHPPILYRGVVLPLTARWHVLEKPCKDEISNRNRVLAMNKWVNSTFSCIFLVGLESSKIHKFFHCSKVACFSCVGFISSWHMWCSWTNASSSAYHSSTFFFAVD